MTVTGEFRVDVRPYTAYADPGLPIAAWVAQGGIAGDASGGDVFMDFLFQRDGDNQTSELFNLEQVAIDRTTTTAVNGDIGTLNMDSLAPNRPLSTQIWAFATITTGTGFTALALQTAKAWLPIWLGAPNRVEGSSGIRVVFGVNLDLALHQVILQGYMWGPRSVLAPGGPRRPVGGLFGNG